MTSQWDKYLLQIDDRMVGGWFFKKKKKKTHNLTIIYEFYIVQTMNHCRGKVDGGSASEAHALGGKG